MEVVSDVASLKLQVETLQRNLHALQNEVHWFEDVIFNRGLNEADIRLLVRMTPRAVRMGLTTETEERKLYLPAEAEATYISPKTVSRRLKRLEQVGAVTYRTEPDPETGNERSYLKVLPVLERPAQINLEDADRGGGSKWENGKRVKRCKCGSANLTRITTTYVVCEDCGTEQPDSRKEKRESVNDTYSHRDCETHDAHGDVEYPILPTNQEEEMGVHSHRDCETLAQKSAPEITKCPCNVESTPVPTELRDVIRWVCWRYEHHEGEDKPRKVPYTPCGRSHQRAKSDDPHTWVSYELAAEVYERSHREGWKHTYHGIGFMLGDGFAGVDWDHCIRDGFISLEASEDLQLLNSYSEVSPSGTGVKAFVLGTLPKGWRKRPEIEMYEAGRFFTFTGRHLVGTPEQVMSRQEELATLHAKYAPPERVERPSKEKTDEPHEYCGHYVQADYSDEEIITRAMKARNGAKFERLWKGDYSDYLKANGKPDQSRADLALCNLLAFWTNDPKTIDRLFRQSGLMRPKWDRAARAGETYGGGTIKRALEGQKDEAA